MLKLKIVSPERIEFDGEEILNDHAPIISTLQKGFVEYGTNGGKQRIDILGGFVSVQQNEVSLCVEVNE